MSDPRPPCVTTSSDAVQPPASNVRRTPSASPAAGAAIAAGRRCIAAGYRDRNAPVATAPCGGCECGCMLGAEGSSMKPGAYGPSGGDRGDLEATVARLSRDLADAIERESATSEVLQAIGRSAGALEPVFDAVLDHAVRLCSADAGMVYRLDGDAYRVASMLGGSDDYRRYVEE